MVKRRKGWDVGRRGAVERFENPNVEDVMYAGALRKLQPVGHHVHLFDDLVRAGELRPELAATSRNQGLRGRV